MRFGLRSSLGGSMGVFWSGVCGLPPAAINKDVREGTRREKVEGERGGGGERERGSAEIRMTNDE
jgi:hypothetical protein